MSSTVTRSLTALALGCLASLALVSPALVGPASADACPAGTYPPSATCVPAAQSSTVTPPGGTVTFVFTGFKPSSSVDLYLHSVPYHLGVFTADTVGTVTVPVTVPAGFPVGAHSVTASGVNPDGTPRTMSAALEVAAAVESAVLNVSPGLPSTSLPFTGMEIGAASLLGAGLLGAGSIAVLGSRRRRTAVTADEAAGRS